MAVYLVTGKLGSGKTLCTVGKIRDYLAQGRVVATNLDLYMENFGNPWSTKTKVFRLPDKPTVDDLIALPRPYEGKYNEDKTGLLVLDECGTWFNTRNFSDKSRQPLINKLLHIRKGGWDVMFIIQHIEMMDKQIREGLGELVAICRRADRLRIPLITPLFGYLGIPLRPPRIHVAEIRYGTHQNAPLNDRWVYRGTNLYDAYDTEQVFGANDCGLHSYLPAYNVYGCTITKAQYAKKRLRERIYNTFDFASSAKRLAFLLGLIGGALFMPNDIDMSISSLVFSSEDKPTSQPKDSTDDKPESKSDKQLKHSLFDSVHIAGSILGDHDFVYVFKFGEQRIYPEYQGYTVHWLGPCKAKLFSMNESHIITCEAKRPADAREGRPVDVDPLDNQSPPLQASLFLN